LTGAVHGDELNGVETIRRLIEQIDPGAVAGSVIAVPIVNVFGFIEGSRYLPDRRDLNRAFPGSRRGSLAGRLARLVIDHVVRDGDVGIDFHTGSDHRINLPQIRADLEDPETRLLARAFGAPVILHSRVRDGSLRQAATELGKTVLVCEAGQPHRFDPEAVRAGIEGTERVMAAIGMVPATGPPATTSIEARASSWVRARRAGIVRLRTSLGSQVEAGEALGEIGDALGGRPTRITARTAGWVIGLSQNPLVNRGDALVHIARTDP
jgi:predicted deacylase